MAGIISPGDLVGGRFRVESLIGTGGMSTVFRGTDEQLGRAVAIKAFPAITADGHDVRRRESEVRLLASLDHPALVTLFDVVEDDGTFVVMQFVDGEDLGRALSRGALEPSEAASIGETIASALATVHANGVIHRDIKPGNVLLPARSAPGSPPALLADFGIARLIDDTTLTAAGSIVGTAQYLSPEQALGADLTVATDIYSLGLVLLESVTGTRAFPGTGVESVAVRLSRDPTIPTTLAAGWRSLLEEMTSRDPQARPRAVEVAKRLNALGGPENTVQPSATQPLLVGHEPTRVMPAGSATTELLVNRVDTPTRRKRPLIVAALIVAAIVIGGAVASVTAFSGSNPAEVSPVQTPSSNTPAPIPSETAVVAPAPSETATAPSNTKPGKDKPCKGNGKKKDC